MMTRQEYEAFINSDSFNDFPGEYIYELKALIKHLFDELDSLKQIAGRRDGH